MAKENSKKLSDANSLGPLTNPEFHTTFRRMYRAHGRGWVSRFICDSMIAVIEARFFGYGDVKRRVRPFSRK